MSDGAARVPPNGAIEKLIRAITSWRTLSVSLLSFSSGLPLGLVWIAIPDWMRDIGMDIRVVGLFTLAQAPWSFKYLWSPLMDRYVPPFWGRRRGWIAVAQVALALLGLLLAGAGDHPDTPWVLLALTLAIAFAAASQDIAIDAYAVDVLRRDEQGIAVGLRTALYRAAMYVAGSLAIFAAAKLGWPAVNVILGLCYLPVLFVTWFAPEPGERPVAPRTMREAVWLPFLECLSRHRALEILAFVVLYKLADNLSQSLLRPFLNDMGYNEFHRGLVFGTAGVLITIGGTFVGGLACTTIGLGHALWIFGFLQIFSNIGYVLITYSPGDIPLMYGAMAFELVTTGLGMGAFGVLLLRMTRKRFSATQYALFSSLFSLPRILAGPVTGLVVDAAGWRWFFWGTMIAGIPGLVLLWRFAPPGVREPEFTVEPPRDRGRFEPADLWGHGIGGFLIGTGLAAATMTALAALKNARLRLETGGEALALTGWLPNPLGAFGEWLDLREAAAWLLAPSAPAHGVQLFSMIVVGAGVGLALAALLAARYGAFTNE